MRIIYKSIHLILGVITIMMIEVILNSSIFKYVIGLGTGYILAGSFCLSVIVIFFADLVMIDKGYKVSKYMWSYAINILILLLLYLFGFIYPPTIDNGTSGYKVNDIYYLGQNILLVIFFSIFLIKSTLVIILKIRKSDKE